MVDFQSALHWQHPDEGNETAGGESQANVVPATACCGPLERCSRYLGFPAQVSGVWVVAGAGFEMLKSFVQVVYGNSVVQNRLLRNVQNWR